MSNLWHVTRVEVFQSGVQRGAGETFIHLCTHAQLDGVISRYFADCESVVCLEIDPALCPGDLRWENTIGGQELFPHLYGDIPAPAVVRTLTRKVE